MSNFICEQCGTPIIDTPNGYKTGCAHYPPDLAYNERYDAWYVIKTGHWTESKCPDPNCDYCKDRPVTANVNLRGGPPALSAERPSPKEGSTP